MPGLVKSDSVFPTEGALTLGRGSSGSLDGQASPLWTYVHSMLAIGCLFPQNQQSPDLQAGLSLYQQERIHCMASVPHGPLPTEVTSI